MENLRETLGDSPERVRWRTKQNLDFAFLMMYSQPKATFYVQLEDDILAKKNFISTMKNYALQKISEKSPWFVLEFCQLGFIGKATTISVHVKADVQVYVLRFHYKIFKNIALKVLILHFCRLFCLFLSLGRYSQNILEIQKFSFFVGVPSGCFGTILLFYLCHTFDQPDCMHLLLCVLIFS